VRKDGGSGVGGDVVVGSVALQHQQDEVAPTGVVCGGDVKDDGNQGPDLLDASNLGMETGDGGGQERVVDDRNGRRRRCNVSRTRRRRWRRDTDDVGEMQLKSGRGSLHLLSLGFGSSGALTGGLECGEGWDQVGGSHDY
jgi:hypothetical protein